MSQDRINSLTLISINLDNERTISDFTIKKKGKEDDIEMI
jgi:hypothetical protein